MKIATPFDLWRAGFEAWLNAWQLQVALGGKMLTGKTAWQQLLREPAPVEASALVVGVTLRKRR